MCLHLQLPLVIAGSFKITVAKKLALIDSDIGQKSGLWDQCWSKYCWSRMIKILVLSFWKLSQFVSFFTFTRKRKNFTHFFLTKSAIQVFCMFDMLGTVLMCSVSKRMHEKNNKSDLNLETKNSLPELFKGVLLSLSALGTLLKILYSENGRTI